jgi:hypothetical protein
MLLQDQEPAQNQNIHKHGEEEMDILKYACNEICCLIKSGFDISLQKIQQILNI